MRRGCCSRLGTGDKDDILVKIREQKREEKSSLPLPSRKRKTMGVWGHEEVREGKQLYNCPNQDADDVTANR